MAADRNPRAPHGQYRLADIPVDDAWVRKNNETLTEVRRLQWSAGILGLIVLGAGVGMLIYSDMDVWGWMIAAVAGVFAIGSLAMIWYIPRKMGSLHHTYANSELVPAVIAEVRPRGVTLLALVDQAVDRSAGKRPALVTRNTGMIPGHEAKVGERVPCVAVAGNRSARGNDNLYFFLSPMPVAWATSDKAEIRRLAKEIPSGEWDTLRKNLERVTEVAAQPTSLLPLD